MIKKKLLAVGVSLVIAMVLVTGCSKSEDATENTSEEAIYVQVTKIAQNTITGTIGELEEISMDDDNKPEIQEGEIPPEIQEGETPPEMPGGETPPEIQEGETPPEIPEGETLSEIQEGEVPSGDMPVMTRFVAGEDTITFTINDTTNVSIENSEEAATIEDIATDSVLLLTLDKDNIAKSIVITNNGEGKGNINGDDENALRVDGATVSLENVTIDKTSGKTSSTENGDFYGMNAGLLALNGANVTIDNATVNTSAQNGNGVFSYGKDTVVNVSNSTIRTTKDNSGGIQTTGGGTTNATNLDVETDGNSSAAIRSDRGGGVVKVDKGKYVTNGSGSPAIYSTADILVANAVLRANNSEAIVVEGKNSVVLTDCDIIGNMTETYKDDEENIHNVMIYQSMSGDAEEGTASFTMTGGSLTAKAGDMFYVTNTSSTIDLSEVAINLANDKLFTIEGNSSSRGWGTEGKNGGKVVCNTTKQVLKGAITVDDISSLDLNMSENTTFEGTINTSEAAGEVNVTIDSSCTWTLTGDSYITSFDGDLANVITSKYTLYVNGVAAKKA